MSVILLLVIVVVDFVLDIIGKMMGNMSFQVKGEIAGMYVCAQKLAAFDVHFVHVTGQGKRFEGGVVSRSQMLGSI